MNDLVHLSLQDAPPDVRMVPSLAAIHQDARCRAGIDAAGKTASKAQTDRKAAASSGAQGGAPPSSNKKSQGRGARVAMMRTPGSLAQAQIPAAAAGAGANDCAGSTAEPTSLNPKPAGLQEFATPCVVSPNGPQAAAAAAAANPCDPLPPQPSTQPHLPADATQPPASAPPHIGPAMAPSVQRVRPPPSFLEASMRDAVRRLAEEDAEMVQRWEGRHRGGDGSGAADVDALPAQLDSCRSAWTRAGLDVSLSPRHKGLGVPAEDGLPPASVNDATDVAGRQAEGPCLAGAHRAREFPASDAVPGTPSGKNNPRPAVAAVASTPRNTDRVMLPCDLEKYGLRVGSSPLLKGSPAANACARALGTPEAAARSRQEAAGGTLRGDGRDGMGVSQVRSKLCV